MPLAPSLTDPNQLEMVSEAEFQARYGITAAAYRGETPALPPSVPDSFPPLLPAVTTALPWLGKVVGGAVAAYGAYQLLTGEGEGQLMAGRGVPLGGPGLPEPAARTVVKEWNTGTAQFYLLTDGRIAVYGKKKKRWKVYRPARHIVVSKNPRLGTLLRASKRLDNLLLRFRKRVKKFETRTRPARYVQQEYRQRR